MIYSWAQNQTHEYFGYHQSWAGISGIGGGGNLCRNWLNASNALIMGIN